MTSPTDPNEEFEDQLRQLLKAEADSVRPSGEGLNLIRERTEHNRRSSWFGLPWLRPAAAVAGALLIASSVILSSPDVRDQVLEIVPAGADREGAPPEQERPNDGGDVAAPTPPSDSPDATTQPEEEPQDEPESSVSPEEEETSGQNGSSTTTSCPEDGDDGPSEAASDGDDEDEPGNGSSDDCDPSDVPEDGNGEEESDNGDENGNGEDDEDDDEEEENSDNGSNTSTSAP